jgi:hypothetical protein
MDVHSHEDRELLIPGVVRIDLLIGRRLGCDGVSSDFFAFDADEQLLAHGCYTKDDEVIKLKTDDGENISVPAERFLPISHPL